MHNKVIAGLALVFVIFEVAQLVIAHRYIGPAQIRRRLHPLEAPETPPWLLSVGWMSALWADYAFQVALFFTSLYIVQLTALLMLGVSLTGFILRRSCGLKWGLVVMTFEGALRVGCLMAAFSLLALPHSWIHTNIPWFSQGAAVFPANASRTISGVSTAGRTTGSARPGR